ncbi:hypothetical protein [Brucella vulpis]|uniref:hypothetical protein n=1 Tax=Brucella vulpis TaxID=981386 RepID=UPI0009E33453
MKNPSIFGSSQKRGVLIPICSRFESVTFRESEAILTLPEVCQQSGGASGAPFSFCYCLRRLLYPIAAASKKAVPPSGNMV